MRCMFLLTGWMNISVLQSTMFEYVARILAEISLTYAYEERGGDSSFMSFNHNLLGALGCLCNNNVIGKHVDL